MITLALLSFLFAGSAHAAESLLSAQATTVTQWRDRSAAPAYTRVDSRGLGEDAEMKTSFTSTLFLGHRILPMTEAYLSPEISAGSGLSGTHGIAGFPNGEIYRVDTPSPKFNISRLFVRQVIGLGRGSEEVPQDINQIAGQYDSRRLTVVAGKFSINDFFDQNIYSHDPRTQFLSWTLMDNGAFDYAADTRGYTWGVMLEYQQKEFAIRYARVTVPKAANQMSMDLNLYRAHADNLEIEGRYSIGAYPGKIRALVFKNEARMGHYRDAIAAGGSPYPDITSVRDYRSKEGVGLNLEQEITSRWGVFARAGWNDGRNETWAFTEIDRSLSGGASWKPFANRRDRVGLAYIMNGLSTDHRDYLKAGGTGFIVGEGGLNYSPEQIGEAYYSWQVHDQFAATGDLQWIENPGYNSDRAGLLVAALRLHVEY